MKPTGILETVLYADDLDAVEAFYAKILKLDMVTREKDSHVFFRCGDQMLLIFNPAVTTRQEPTGALPIPPHGAAGAGHVCFKATGEDIALWKTRLENHGIEIEADFEWPRGGRSIYFRDPAGNCLEFAEPRIWGLG